MIIKKDQRIKTIFDRHQLFDQVKAVMNVEV